MPTFKRPPKLTIEIDPYSALIAVHYWRLTGEKEQAPTLSGMLDYVADAILEAVQGKVRQIRSEHLVEQSEAHVQELLRGVDRIWEATMEDMETDGEDGRDETP